MNEQISRPTALPPIVTPAEWEAAHDVLLAKEKAATKALDALAAERRRQPMVAIRADYAFEGPDGSCTLLDVFQGRRQLIVYHFMFGPGDVPCVGCSGFTDNVGRLAHLNARDTSFALISRAPLPDLDAYRRRMGWQLPWYSSGGSSFNEDLGLVGPGDNDRFALSVFLRDGDAVYRSYVTSGRGVDRLRIDMNLLDLTPFGRQESWEDSPPGWPRSAPGSWWRRHDEYETGAPL
jgi:predicted dithiol-disulfide oxidoreductase (DUF899 family)